MVLRVKQTLLHVLSPKVNYYYYYYLGMLCQEFKESFVGSVLKVIRTDPMFK